MGKLPDLCRYSKDVSAAFGGNRSWMASCHLPSRIQVEIITFSFQITKLVPVVLQH